MALARILKGPVNDNAILPSLATVNAWAGSGTYELAAVSTFLEVADY